MLLVHMKRARRHPRRGCQELLKRGHAAKGSRVALHGGLDGLCKILAHGAEVCLDLRYVERSCRGCLQQLRRPEERQELSLRQELEVSRPARSCEVSRCKHMAVHRAWHIRREPGRSSTTNIRHKRRVSSRWTRVDARIMRITAQASDSEQAGLVSAINTL